MPFATLAAADLDRVAQEILAALRRCGRPPIPPDAGLSFADIERAARDVGRRVAAGITADALAAAAAEQEEFAACPGCGHRTRVTRKKREVRTLDGPVDYLEPAAHCVGCRRDFFPSAPPAAPE